MSGERPKRLPWTVEQAKIIYLTLEALLNQFEAENRRKLAESTNQKKAEL